MRVFKFGGASVKDAAAVKNVAGIITQFSERPLVVVVSAMAKTTNALEEVVRAWPINIALAKKGFQEIMRFHADVASSLFDIIPAKLAAFFEQLETETIALLDAMPPATFGEAYDSIVHRGELLSTQIVATYLQESAIDTSWIDTREIIITNNAHRRATVNWETTSVKCKEAIHRPMVYVVQGFIGSTPEGVPTTLGREGSDYTAAVIANVLNADEVTIWKDVPGVLNGDPKVFEHSVLLEEISYREAIELAYYGASVIHPKTIQPLQQKEIPLHVRSFIHPEQRGTVIQKGLLLKPLVPCFIKKANQLLISLSTRDLAFIVEEHMQAIYSIFSTYGVTVNTMQNSAVSTSFCVQADPLVLPEVLRDLDTHFAVKTNAQVVLYTIRHHNAESRKAVVGSQQPLLEQITRQTYQVVLPA